MAEHTPGPYVVSETREELCVWGHGGQTIMAECGEAISDANVADAEHIRLTLTCHDDLLAVARLIAQIDASEEDWLDTRVITAASEQARAVLAKVKEGGA